MQLPFLKLTEIELSHFVNLASDFKNELVEIGKQKGYPPSLMALNPMEWQDHFKRELIDEISTRYRSRFRELGYGIDHEFGFRLLWNVNNTR